MKKILTLLILISAQAFAQMDTAFWTANGVVQCFESQGNTLYFGGQAVNYTGPVNGCLVPVQASTESVLPGYDKINGSIKKIISDNNGGWYVCGDFNVTARPNIRNVAHILPGHVVDTTFSVSTDDIVLSIALSGTRLFIGGEFKSVNGSQRILLAALDPANGNLLPWNASIDSLNGYSVNALSTWGGYLYVGGRFQKLTGVTRNNLAELDTATAVKTAWNPNVNAIIFTMKVVDSTLYIGGLFTSVTATARKCIASWTLINHGLTTLNSFITMSGGASLFISDLEVVGNSVYIVGQFDQYLGIARRSVARISKTGALNAWVANTIAANHYCVKYHDGKIYFDGVADYESIYRFMITDTLAGATQPTDMKMCGYLQDIAFDGDTLYLAGNFSSVSGTNGPGLLRNHMGAINTTTGFPLGFAPAVDGTVNDMKLVNGKLIIAGQFTQVAGLPRQGLAMVDPVTGIPEAWSPAAYGASALFLHDNLLYVTGSFDTINGIPQGCVTAFDTLTFVHVPTSIQIKKSGFAYGVRHMHFWGDKVFIAGAFDTINGVARRWLACYDLNSQSVTAFDAKIASIAGTTVGGTLHFNNRFFVYGGFSSIGDSLRETLAELDTATGSATAWNPDLNYVSGGSAKVGLIYEDSLLLGGDIRVYGSSPQYDDPLVIVDPLTGGHRIWSDSLTSEGTVYSMHMNGNRLYAGGNFRKMNRQIRHGLASWIISPQPPEDYYQIRGNVFNDVNGDCQRNGSDAGLNSMIMKAEPGAQYAGTDVNGDYLFHIRDTGTYVVSQIPLTSLFHITQRCPASNDPLTASVDTLSTTVSDINFADSVTHCHLLYIDCSSSRRRLCTRSTTVVSFYNAGIAAAPNVEVKVVYPPQVIPLTSDVPWTTRQDSLLVWSIGTMAPGERRSIRLTDSVVCNLAYLGLTSCVHADITPDQDCIAANAQWDGSDIVLNGSCGNPTASFTLFNNGSGDMDDSSNARVFYDSLLVYESRFLLRAGDSAVLSVPAGGQTIRVEADQRPFHPSLQGSSVTLEACDTSGVVSLGYVNQYNDDDDNPVTATACKPLTAAYDPNEKEAVPAGVGPQHYVLPQSEIEYTIHFQNTGNDTALNVFVQDTLDENLDIATFTPGVSSHPCHWTVGGSGRPVITFSFESIFLPDSGTGHEASEGFVQFSIRSSANALPGTVIRNKAGIYFDFNAAVLTNETYHTIAASLPSDYSLGTGITISFPTGMNSLFAASGISVYPQPMQRCVEVKMESYRGEKVQFELTDVFGVTVFKQEITSGKQVICLESLSAGIYSFRVTGKEGVLGTGKILKVE